MTIESKCDWSLLEKLTADLSDFTECLSVKVNAEVDDRFAATAIRKKQTWYLEDSVTASRLTKRTAWR